MSSSAPAAVEGVNPYRMAQTAPARPLNWRSTKPPTGKKLRKKGEGMHQQRHRLLQWWKAQHWLALGGGMLIQELAYCDGNRAASRTAWQLCQLARGVVQI